MAKTLKSTKLNKRFTEHDLRAKVASDTNIEHAQSLLGHISESTTRKYYIRKPTLVKPTR
jgi:integrase